MGTNLKTPWRRGLDCSGLGEAASELKGIETAASTQLRLRLRPRLRLREADWLMAKIGQTKRSEMEHVSHANYSVIPCPRIFPFFFSFLQRRIGGKGRKEMRGQDIRSESLISR
jgi:hypothetical protein